MLVSCIQPNKGAFFVKYDTHIYVYNAIDILISFLYFLFYHLLCRVYDLYIYRIKEIDGSNKKIQRPKNKPVTLILRWKPKNTTGWSGVKARWTSVSIEIRSIFFSGECKTQVCSVSKSHDLIVQSCSK